MQRLISAEEALSGAHIVDYVATIPYSSNIEAVGNRLNPVLSVMSKMALDASAVVWEHQPGSQLIMIGETCYPGLPTTSDLMGQRVAQTRGNKPKPGKLVPLAKYNGETLDNSAYHVSGLAEYLHDNPTGSTLAVGMRYHADRILTHAAGYGLDLEYVAAEDVLEAAGKIEEYEPYLDAFAKIERSERVLRVLTRLNPRGGLLKKVIRITGPRVVDFRRTAGGEIQFINSTAKRRLVEEARKLQTVA